MIPNDKILPPIERKEYIPLPEDVYHAELIDVEYREGTNFNTQEPEERLNFTFAIIDEGDNYGRRVWKEVRPVISVKPKHSNLWELVKQLTGREFTNEECLKQHEQLTPEFLNSLVGIHKRLALSIHTSQTGRKSNKISSIMPMDKEMEPYKEDKADEKAPF
jgi:hypothetical protein